MDSHAKNAESAGITPILKNGRDDIGRVEMLSDDCKYKSGRRLIKSLA